ncbi:E3 ubiquitin-protein ligase [Epichloe bromicola]|uniref:HECT-type E3 ubiquitin transferase n=1 Tax=Epichloe bromicola TaxID=79588 RepID=A0ABQ0CE16_9HYPO
MFSTFTGNSRRPRNVNLSGQAGNPFVNTSWSPAVVSNATKTVSDAQAQREKRHLERQRLKAAGKIQSTWRGHQTRCSLANGWRAAFDDLYRSSASHLTVAERLPLAFNLLLSFFSQRSFDDLQRAYMFAKDCESAHIEHIAPRGIHVSRLTRLTDILTYTLGAVVSEKANSPFDLSVLLKLISRLTSYNAQTILNSIDSYYTALAGLYQDRRNEKWGDLLFDALNAPLNVVSFDVLNAAYKALAFAFFTSSDLGVFETHSARLSSNVKTTKLAETIQFVYGSLPESLPSKQDLLWLLAHFISLGRASLDSSAKFAYLNALLVQLTYLSPEISTWINLTTKTGDRLNDDEGASLQPLSPYVSKQLLSLVDHDGISNILQDFSSNLAHSASMDSYGTSLLAGYILTLLHCFPANADETRMRLFLEQIPTVSGSVPTIKFLWQILRQAKVFAKVERESERPLDIIQRYLRTTPNLSQESTEEQEWRVILLFLELYTFILRLSDDEDFFSGMTTQIVETNSSTSRLHECSLSLSDVQRLTVFLKNTAFVLHYKARELSQTHKAIEAATKSRLDSYLGAEDSPQNVVPTDKSSPSASTKLDLDGLRAIITTALKMLYERDSRKHFLPPNHWLMNAKLEQEDFINAVIAEEERQSLEDDADSDDNGDEHGVAGNLYDEDSSSYSTMAGQRVSRHARLERIKTQQIRAQRERRLAEMRPKLEILKHMPFVVPFETRVQIFRQFIRLDRMRREESRPFSMHPFSRHHAKIKRGQLFGDAFNQFYELGDDFKDTIQITFVDQFDTPEAGIDGGGVTKEFLIGVTSEAFANDENSLGMFSSNEQGLLFPNPTAADTLRESLRQGGLSEHDPEWRAAVTGLLQRFEFLGRIIGKCLYDGILVDLAFAGFFLLKWPSSGPRDENTYKGSINDLRDMDEELYKGLLRLKNYSGDVSELGFDFTVTDKISPPGQPVQTVTRKLIPQGDSVPVTNDNRLLYISYAARHRLVIQPKLQTSAFLTGLRSIIRPSWLSMFNQSELQRLVGGDSSEIDIDDLRRNTVYSGLYAVGDDNLEHPTIVLFWKVMAGFTDSQRRDVLKYVSSTPRAPLLGFSQLRPKFSIRDGGTDEDRLPSTSTCVNLLKLPRYTSEAVLREKLLYAITSGAGFDLS